MHRIYIPGFGRNPNVQDSVSAFLNQRKKITGRLYRTIDGVTALKELTKDTYFIVAYSFGAAAAIEFAATRPEQVTGMVLLDPLMGNPNFLERLRERIKEGLANKKKTGKPWNDITWKNLARHTIAMTRFTTLKRKKFTVNAPTHFIWGVEDLSCPLNTYKKKSVNFTNKTLEVIQKYGHDWINNPALLKKYLEKLV